MSRKRSAEFQGRHFDDVVIMLCVRWYLRYSLSYRDLKEMMAERGLTLHHVTVFRWVQYYAPLLNQRLRRELRRPNGSWRWLADGYAGLRVSATSSPRWRSVPPLLLVGGINAGVTLAALGISPSN